MWFFKRRRVRRAERERQAILDALSKGGPMDLLLHILTLGPLAGYRTIIGVFLYLYATIGAMHGWPGAGEHLKAVAEGVFGIGIAGKMSPGGNVAGIAIQK